MNKEAVRVAYQGADGAYSHLAATNHFSEKFEKIHCLGFSTFAKAARAVKCDQADYAILPIENTTAGSINQVYDLLADIELPIVGEEKLKVKHCLLAAKDVPVTRIKRVFSHPQALMQCSEYLESLDCVAESYIDTALSAKKIYEDGDESQAAIAGAHAADVYGLHIIARDLANTDTNYTRFVVIAKKPQTPTGPAKTSLLLVTNHEQGALVECLSVLEEHNINMTKLESRPIPNTPWKYRFYIDIEANTNKPHVQQALDELRQKAADLLVLGCYTT